jgi:hypothetical protein
LPVDGLRPGELLAHGMISDQPHIRTDFFHHLDNLNTLHRNRTWTNFWSSGKSGNILWPEKAENKLPIVLLRYSQAWSLYG